jgi:prevent-host-death family protein
MESTITATEARVRFGELLRRVTERGETIIVERAGKPQAVVVSVDEYRRLQAGQEQTPTWREKLRRTHDLIRAERGDQELHPPVDELIRQMREERDAQLVKDLPRR